MFEKLLNLISLTYWSHANHCGGEFDETGCRGHDGIGCRHYDFCRQYNIAEEEIKKFQQQINENL